jgi:LuxR family transcriptional regulator, maltose regulon positive regulatory protein
MARIHEARGDLDDALDLLGSAQPMLMIDFSPNALARVLLASGSAVQASGLLDRLLQAGDHGGRPESMIEILVLHALANDVRGDMRAALVPLERALTLAEPEALLARLAGE